MVYSASALIAEGRRSQFYYVLGALGLLLPRLILVMMQFNYSNLRAVELFDLLVFQR
jgi:hypothetical protein